MEYSGSVSCLQPVRSGIQRLPTRCPFILTLEVGDVGSKDPTRASFGDMSCTTVTSEAWT